MIEGAEMLMPTVGTGTGKGAMVDVDADGEGGSDEDGDGRGVETKATFVRGQYKGWPI